MPIELWKNVRYVAVGEDDSLESSGGGWAAGASSNAAILSGDGYAEFTTAEIDREKIAGLGRVDSNQSYHDIDFAFYMDHSGGLHIYESGSLVRYFGPYAADDRLRVEVAGGRVRYRKNGA